MAEEKTGARLTEEPERDERQRDPATTASEKATLTAETVSPCENVRAEPTRLQGNVGSEPGPSGGPSYEDGGRFSKPAVSYVALISQVILSSCSQKLNLASIYEAMEERFPYFRSRRSQGWRNSVRHNLSVNDCFVKVSRCEDGKGHYWGIHPAHLSDFRQGNFRQHRQPRRSREGGAPHAGTAGRPGRTEPAPLWAGFYRIAPGSLGWAEPQYPPRDHSGYAVGPLDWPEPRYHHGRWGRTEPPGGGGRQYYFPDSPPRSHDTAIVGSWSHGLPLTPTWRVHSWCNPTLRGVTESHDAAFARRPQQPPCTPPGCQRGTPVYRDVIKPVPYYVNCFFYP